MVNIVFIIKHQQLLVHCLTSFIDSNVNADFVKESHKHLGSLHHD